MLAYIGISCIAVTILISGIRWVVAKAGYRFPRLFWLSCLAAVLTVCIFLPRVALELMGVFESLTLSFTLLCALALWLASTFAPQTLQTVSQQPTAATNDIGPAQAAATLPASIAIPEPVPVVAPAVGDILTAVATPVAEAEFNTDDEAQDEANLPLFDEDPAIFMAALSDPALPAANAADPAENIVAPSPLAGDAQFKQCEEVAAAITAAIASLACDEELAILPQESASDERLPAKADEQPNPDLLPASDKLDDLLDFALVQRTSKRFDLALAAIQAAILLYSDKNLDCLPYLIVEQAAIHKEQGHYEQAVQSLREGEALLQLDRFLAWRYQFAASSAYLELTCDILRSHGHALVPPAQIPIAVQSEIEAAFLARNHLHQPS